MNQNLSLEGKKINSEELLVVNFLIDSSDSSSSIVLDRTSQIKNNLSSDVPMLHINNLSLITAVTVHK